MSPASSSSGTFRRIARRLEATLDRWGTESRLRAALIAGLAILGLLALSDLMIIVVVAADLADGQTSRIIAVANDFARVEIADTRGVFLLLVRAVLDVAVGVLLLLGGALVIRNEPRRGLAVAQVVLLLSLTVVNLLIFYFEQFAAAASALTQFALLYVAGRYQDRFTDDDDR